MDRPEDRRSFTRTEAYYPHPAHGLDTDEARERVQANPAVMPPSPTPSTRRSWANREILGMRALPLVSLIGFAMSLPLFVSWLSRRKPSEPEHHVGHGKAHERHVKKALTRKMARSVAKAASEGYPRFVVLASRPWGRHGKKARALILGKVEQHA